MMTHRNRRTPQLNLYINNNKIKQVNFFKYLGVKIDERLLWNEHIKSVESKISQACGATARLRHFVDQRCLRTLYFGHAYSHLQYSLLAWGCTLKKRLNRLNVLHNRLIRLMALHGPLREFNFNNNEIYKSLELLNIEELYKLELAKFMHRAVNNSLPTTLINHFYRPSRTNMRSTSTDPFIVNAANRAAYRNWITTSGINLWGNIDSSLKQLPYQLFKNKYKQKLLRSY